jgi:hypothetical protein
LTLSYGLKGPFAEGLPYIKYPPNTEPVSGVVIHVSVTAPLGSTEIQRREGGDSWARDI